MVLLHLADNPCSTIALSFLRFAKEPVVLAIYCFLKMRDGSSLRLKHLVTELIII